MPFEAIKKNSNQPNKIFIITGPSGVGKTTVLQKLPKKALNLTVAVPHTTRTIREGEAEGKDYHYVNKLKFYEMKKKNAFLTSIEFKHHSYGITKKNIDYALQRGDVITILEPTLGHRIKEIYKNTILIFIIPESFQDVIARLKDRYKINSIEFVKDKNVRARIYRSINMYSHCGFEDYFLLNKEGKLYSLIKTLISVVINERTKIPPRKHIQSNIVQAKHFLRTASDHTSFFSDYQQKQDYSNINLKKRRTECSLIYFKMKKAFTNRNKNVILRLAHLAQKQIECLLQKTSDPIKINKFKRRLSKIKIWREQSEKQFDLLLSGMINPSIKNRKETGSKMRVWKSRL